MSKVIAVVILFLTILICSTIAYKKEKKHTPVLIYTSVDTSSLNYRQEVYVPVNSKLYSEKRPGRLNLTTVLKIRNTSFSDSIYVFKIDYYDTEGRTLKKYIDSVLLVKPMSTTEIIVKKDEFKTAGDNFIVEWRANKPKQFPLIQAITSDPETKLSFTTEGILMNKEDSTRN